MNNLFNHIKRISLTALAVIVFTCSIPQFSIRSEAAATTTSLIPIIYYLTTYLATHGYSIINDAQDTFTSLAQWKEQTNEDISELLYEFAAALNAFGLDHNHPGLGDEFLRALQLAALTGSFIISRNAQRLVTEYLESATDANGTLNIATVTSSIQEFANPANFVYNFAYNNNSYSITFPFETIAIIRVTSTSYPLDILFLPANVEDFTYNALSNSYSLVETSKSGTFRTATVTYNNAQYTTYYRSIYPVPSFKYFEQTVTDGTQEPDYLSVFSAYLAGQYAEVEGGHLSVSRITDTSNTSVLTSSNEIASDGSVEGDFTLYLPYGDALVQIIDRYNDQEITYDQLINALGLSAVASDATVTEKENALAGVSVPDSTYDWLTRTAWGSETIAETTTDMTKTHSEEDSIADSIGDTLKGGNDSEDDNNKNRGKGLLAALLIGLGIWSTPIIAGDPSGESDSGGTDDGSGDDDSHPGYLQDTIAGMAIAGTVMDSFFSAAGGSDGYGFVYTVGASFVIFSVVIGAANYFGALFHGDDTKQMKKSSAKNNSPNKTRKQSSYSNKNGIVT